jgi:large subunit ribosomal protein L25
MMKEIKLVAQKRDEKSGTPKKIRQSGFIPAIIYGPSTENRKLKVKKADFEKIHEQVGESNLFNLEIVGEKTVKAVIKDVQTDVVKDKIIHIDFYEVDMQKKIEVEVPLNFIGEVKAVKELGGILSKNMEEIEIKCLPEDLPDHIDVDLSTLNTFDDVIKISDLNIPKGVEVLNGADEVVASVLHPKAEEEKEQAEGEEEESKEKKEETKEEGGKKEATD